MPDMLVKLYELPNIEQKLKQLHANDIQIKRALTLDTQKILQFVDQHFSDLCAGWVDECELSLKRHPVACFIAVHNKQVVGFACYDTSAKGYFGPLGVAETHRKQGIAKVLIVHALEAMYNEGYAYGIIPWVSSEGYYQKAVGAITIPDSEPGVYKRLI